MLIIAHSKIVRIELNKFIGNILSKYSEINRLCQGCNCHTVGLVSPRGNQTIVQKVMGLTK